jgi:hypothetical protein
MNESKLMDKAREAGVKIIYLYSSLKGDIWCADVENTDREIARYTKLSELIKFLTDNNIKINN